MHAPNAPATARQGLPIVELGIAAVAASQLFVAGWMLVAPHGFHASLGAFGPYNGHYLHDALALTAGVGVALALAVRWPALRPGALVAATAASGFHAVNHWFDLGNGEPGTGAGALGALGETSLTVVCALLLWAVLRERAA